MKRFLLVILAVFLLCGTAQATTIWADHMVVGDGIYTTADADFVVNSDRTNHYNALGVADGNFFSLGLGGSAYFEFGSLFDTQASIVEITWGKRNNYLETANIFVFNEFGVISDPALSIDNSSQVTTLDLTGFASISPFIGFMIQDTSSGTNRDGWDVDSIGVSPVVAPVPEPATMFLLGFGLLGLVGSRKKFNK